VVVGFVPRVAFIPAASQPVSRRWLPHGIPSRPVRLHYHPVSHSDAFRMSLPNMLYYAVICPVVPLGSFVATTRYEAMVMLHFLGVCVDLAGREANAMFLTPEVVECFMQRQ
jgi:hypothetical protein